MTVMKIRAEPKQTQNALVRHLLGWSFWMKQRKLQKEGRCEDKVGGDCVTLFALHSPDLSTKNMTFWEETSLLESKVTALSIFTTHTHPGMQHTQQGAPPKLPLSWENWAKSISKNDRPCQLPVALISPSFSFQLLSLFFLHELLFFQLTQIQQILPN